MSNSLAELTATAAEHPILATIVVIFTLFGGLQAFQISMRVLLLLVKSMRQEFAEIGELAGRLRDELRSWQLEAVDRGQIRPISLEEAYAHLRLQGIVPSPTIRVVSALSDAWLAHRSRKAFNVVVNEPSGGGVTLQEHHRLTRYRLNPASLGSVREGINLDKAIELADSLEDEQLVNKIEQRK